MGLFTGLTGLFASASPGTNEALTAPQASSERQTDSTSSERPAQRNESKSASTASYAGSSVKRGRPRILGEYHHKAGHFDVSPKREGMTPGRKRMRSPGVEETPGSKRRVVQFAGGKKVGLKSAERPGDDDDDDDDDDDGEDEDEDEVDDRGDADNDQGAGTGPASIQDGENFDIKEPADGRELADSDEPVNDNPMKPEEADEEADEPDVDADSEQFQEEFGSGTNTLVVKTSQYEYTPSTRRRSTHNNNASPTNPSTTTTQDRLRAEGWDDDHIELYMHLSRRGFQPVLPHYFRFEYKWFMPDILFSENDTDAIINTSAPNPKSYSHARRALDMLFDIGPSMRDATLSPHGTPPERPFKKYLGAYMKWAERDSGLDRKSGAFPLVIAQTAGPDTPVAELRLRAEKRLERIVARYRVALRESRRVHVSSQAAGAGEGGYAEVPADEIPTLYAFICRHTTVVLGAYRALTPARDDDGEEQEAEAPTLKTVAAFRFDQHEFDIYSAFAMAMTVCHCRNVQLRIARYTGIGLKAPNVRAAGDDAGGDPDA